MNRYNNDTICAISTAHGVGGIAVIRVSGADAINVVAKSWRGAEIASMKSHTAHLGRIIDVQGAILDEVVITLFRNPNSFTGEDVVEIACHGSLWIQQQIIQLLISNGCRTATGGEFTQRSFLNGKLDLSQAEAIADVIASSSAASHRIAISQMRGGFSRELSALRDQLLDFVALMELELDFSEEEVEFADRAQLITLAEEISRKISRLANSFSVGNAIKNGIPVAIVGETNAGKSTLLNTLLNEDKAIVSDIHGTTRDVIEDTINISGVTFRFIDTAGIRETTDTIESIGIERTYQKIDQANIILWIIDATTPIAQIEQISPEILTRASGKELAILVNKSDTLTTTQQEQIHTALSQIVSNAKEVSDSAQIIFISAKESIGIEQIESYLIDRAQIPSNTNSDIIVTNTRHYEALTRALEAIDRALNGLHANISGDFVSQDIRETMHYLGEITGEISHTDILQTIFSRFCIGK
ncbi:MAG: tRNA uridine-5-carboxymethylaminomethyl(34) synthesis GTPase MnmE [Bacteroidales bacterium]